MTPIAPATAPAGTPAPSSPNPRAKRKLSKGKLKTADRILLYGREKIGKSTFASGAPGAIWLGQDGGTAQLDVTRWPQPKTWEQALQALDDMFEEREDHGLETVVIDPLNWFETNLLVPYAARHSDAKNKFAKFDVIAEQWRIFRNKCERLWEAGVSILLIAHSTSKAVNDPETAETYDKHTIALQGSGAGMWLQWVDTILFGKRDHYAVAVAGGKKFKAGGTDAVYIYTTERPGFDAGNRWDLPPRLPMSYSAMSEARESRAAELKAEIEAAVSELEGLGKTKIRGQIDALMASASNPLSEILNALRAKLDAARPAPEPETETTEESESA